MKGDTRTLDYGSYGSYVLRMLRVWFRALGVWLAV